MTGLPLLDWDPPAVRSSATSRAAAESIAPKAGTLRALVLDAIQKSAYGLTDEDLQEILHLNPSTQRPRRIELVRMGLVCDSGETRLTRSGRKATVWVAK